jgi:hypothetical protein
MLWSGDAFCWQLVLQCCITPCVDAGGWWCVMAFAAGGVLKKYVTVFADVMSGSMCDA